MDMPQMYHKLRGGENNALWLFQKTVVCEKELILSAPIGLAWGWLSDYYNFI